MLLPYLERLDEDQWFTAYQGYPNNIAWIVTHIAKSEDYWVTKVGLKSAPTLAITSTATPLEIITGYVQVREQTEKVLTSLNDRELNSPLDIPEFSDGWIPPSLPTWKWLFHHVFTHEAYHAGQIGVIARLSGFKGPLF